MLKGFIQDIHEIIPNISEYRLYKVIYSIKARYNKYGTFGLGKRDGYKFGISERQMPKLINLLIDYGFLVVKGEVKHSKGFFKCRVFNISAQFKEILMHIKDYTHKKIKNLCITPIEWMKANVPYTDKYGIYKFDYNGVKYVINKRGGYAGALLDTSQNKIINIYNLI